MHIEKICEVVRGCMAEEYTGNIINQNPTVRMDLGLGREIVITMPTAPPYSLGPSQQNQHQCAPSLAYVSKPRYIAA